MAPEVVIFLGRLLRTGKLDFTRTIAVGGSEIESPQYARVKVGAQLSSILNGQLLPAQHNVRIINGNPLVGEKASLDDFLGAHVTEITAIPEVMTYTKCWVGFVRASTASQRAAATSHGWAERSTIRSIAA